MSETTNPVPEITWDHAGEVPTIKVWTAALRGQVAKKNGKPYAKGLSALWWSDSGRMCCLGVAADLVGCEWIESRGNILCKLPPDLGGFVGNSDFPRTLIRAILLASGISPKEEMEQDICSVLAIANDHPLPWKEMADAIDYAASVSVDDEQFHAALEKKIGATRLTKGKSAD